MSEPLPTTMVLKRWNSCVRELLLLTGIASQGFGNWKKIAEHIGTRTKEEVESHYNAVYVDSPNWPLPVGFVAISS